MREHAAITERARMSRAGNKYASGKYAANGAMRFARAVWNHAKNELETPGLPDRNPFRSGKLFHKERARETGMGDEDLPRWWTELQKLENPIRREMHLFMLLSGLRRNDVLTARWSNLDQERRALRIPSPKGGDERAFDLPLSEPLWECLQRAKEAGLTFFPEQSRTWIFPAENGHVAEVILLAAQLITSTISPGTFQALSEASAFSGNSPPSQTHGRAREFSVFRSDDRGNWVRYSRRV